MLANYANQISSPMATALAELALLNTSQPFQTLQRNLYSLTRSLPLIVHHRQKIAKLLVAAMTNPNRVELALSASHTVDLLPAFIQSLSPDPDFQLLDFETLLSPLMLALVALALDPPALNNNTGGDRGNDPHSQTEISKRAFQVLAWTFREIGGDLVNKGDHWARSTIAWSWVASGLRDSALLTAEPLALAASKPDTAVDSAALVMPAEEADEHEEIAQVDINAEEEEGESGVPMQIVTNGDLDGTSGAPDAEDSSDNDTELANTSVIAIQSRRRPASSTRPHLRRILATCFAFLVRKASSGKALNVVTAVMLQDLEKGLPFEEGRKLQESLAWILLESAKSVETYIHSRARSIFKAAIAAVREKRIELGVFVLMAALTALLHGSNAENLAELVNTALIGVGSLDRDVTDPFSMMLDVQLASVLAGTRKGNRLSDKTKEYLLVTVDRHMQHLSEPYLCSQIDEFVRFATKCLLIAPGLEVMLSKGRKVLQGISQLPRSVRLSCCTRRTELSGL